MLVREVLQQTVHGIKAEERERRPLSFSKYLLSNIKSITRIIQLEASSVSTSLTNFSSGESVTGRQPGEIQFSWTEGTSLNSSSTSSRLWLCTEEARVSGKVRGLGLGMLLFLVLIISETL